MIIHPCQQQRLLSASHCNIEKPPWRVRILTLTRADPISVDHRDVLELKSLSTMGRQQQQSGLPMVDTTAPIDEPLQEVVERLLLLAGIQPGDRLTTASLLGHAMKATDAGRSPGAVIGKAMTGLDEATGLVLVLVSLQ